MADNWLILKRKLRFAYTKSWRYLFFIDDLHLRGWCKVFEPGTFIKTFYQEIRGPKWHRFVWDKKYKIYRKVEFESRPKNMIASWNLRYLWPTYKNRWAWLHRQPWRQLYFDVKDLARRYSELYQENQKLRHQLRCAEDARDHWHKRYQEMWAICVKEKAGPGKYLMTPEKSKRIREAIRKEKGNLTQYDNSSTTAPRKKSGLGKIETAEDLAKASGTFAAEMNLKNKKK